MTCEACGGPIREYPYRRRWLDPERSLHAFCSRACASVWINAEYERMFRDQMASTMPGVRYTRLDEITACPTGGDTYLRELANFVGVICGLGHTTFARSGQWDREAARPPHTPLMDGLSERRDDLSFRKRSGRRKA